MTAIALRTSDGRPLRPDLPRAVRERLSDLSDRASSLDSEALLRMALHEFRGKIAVVSSFAAESVVLLHQIAKIDPTTPVLFLNTGKLFGETLRYRDRVQDVLGLCDIRSIGPHPHDRSSIDPEGTLWSRDPDACCDFRKVTPIRSALRGFESQVTGRKRFQSAKRASLEKIEYSDGRFRFNPLAEWTQEMLTAYIEERNLPRHPLVNDGYPSIGCMHCTRRVSKGAGYRSGRWSEFEKDECGIHTGVDGEGI